MVKGVLDSTVAGNDFYTLFDNIVATNPQLNKTITEVRNESNLFLCKVLRFYTNRDLCLVRELNNGKEYMCHVTHEMVSYEVSLQCMCDGKVKHDTGYGTYIEPYNDVFGIVASVRFKGTTDEKCLLSCLNYNSDESLFSSVRNGEIKLKVGDSTLSLTNNRVNLMTPTLLINGLPYNEPKLNNYYDKSEIDIIKNDTNAQLEELDEKIDDLDIEHITSLINHLNDIVGNLDVDSLISQLNDLDTRLTNHNHDNRYYTESEVDDLLNNKANKNHTHDASEITGLDIVDEYDVGFTYDFGLSGIDDSLNIHTFLKLIGD